MDYSYITTYIIISFRNSWPNKLYSLSMYSLGIIIKKTYNKNHFLIKCLLSWLELNFDFLHLNVVHLQKNCFWSTFKYNKSVIKIVEYI